MTTSMTLGEVELLLGCRWLVAHRLRLDLGQAEAFWRLACELLREFPEEKEARSIAAAAQEALSESADDAARGSSTADAIPLDRRPSA